MNFTLTEWLAKEPFTLALSSAYFGFFAHCGALAALEERGLRPRKVTGASAGALVGGGLASGLSALEMRELFASIQLSDFWDPKPGFGLLRGEKFRRLLERHFRPTFDELAIPFEAAAVDVRRWREEFLSSGSVPNAVYASCAVPLLFHPIRIDGRLWIDGGVLNKSGVNHRDADGSRGDGRVFCVFLASKGLTGAYELRRSYRPLTPSCGTLRMRGLPQVRPQSLANGPAAFTDAYRRTRAALDLPAAADQIIDV